MSDKIVGWLVTDSQVTTLVDTVKGWVFVAVTALLLNALLRRGEPAPTHGGARPPRWPLAVGAVVILGLTAAGIAHTLDNERASLLGTLRTVAVLKGDQITDWVRERVEDARIIQLSEVLEEGDPGRAVTRLEDRLAPLTDDHHFTAISLYTATGDLRWSTPGAPRVRREELRHALGSTPRNGGVRWGGPLVDAAGDAWVDFTVSLQGRDGERLVLVLHVDPEAWFFPALRDWPALSHGGDILLARRSGERVQIIDAMRSGIDAAPVLTRPISDSELLSERGDGVHLPSGAELRGRDYRGVSSIGVAQPIAGTDWDLVVKVDEAELIEEVATQGAWIVLVGVLTLAVAAGVLLLVRQARQLAYAAGIQREQAERLRAMKLLDAIVNASRQPIFAKDLEGRFTLFNRAASVVSGQPAEAVLGKDERAFLPSRQAEDIVERSRRAVETGETSEVEDALELPGGRRIMRATTGPLRDADGRIFGSFGIVHDLTEIHIAEERVRESEERLRAVLDITRDGVFDWDVSTGASYLSPRCYEVLGYAPEEAAPAADLFLSLVLPEDRPEVKAVTAAHLRGESPSIEVDFRLGEAGGEVRWVRARGQVVERGPDGEAVRLVGSITDITQRKEAEIALQESERRFQDVVQATADWVWEIDAEARYTYASESVRALLGYEPREILGKSPFDLMPPDEAARVGAAFGEIAARRETFRDLANTIRRRDGGLVHVLTSGAPILAPDGSLLGYRGLDRDVTDQRRSTAALEERDARYRAVIETSPDGFWTLDGAGRILAVNEAYVRRSGYAREELLTMRVQELTDESAGSVRERIEEVVRMGSDVFEVRHRTRAGELWPVEVTASYSPLAGGRLFAFLRDIGERRAAEDALHQRNAELERFNRATVGRELDMIALKTQVNDLCVALGREPPYPLAFLGPTRGEDAEP